MDFKEFEQYVADYVEGNLDEDLRRRMDKARAASPKLDELARLHEQILTALADAPQVKAPAGLAEKIVAEAAVLERLAALEQKAYRRGMGIGIAAAAVGAFSLAICLWMLDATTGTATLDAIRAAGNNWLAQASLTLIGWLDTAGTALQAKVSIPVVQQTVPVYILLLSLLVSGVLAFFREEIMTAVDSF